MKWFFRLWMAVAVLALFAVPAMADITEGFETFSGSGYGTYDVNGFHLVNAYPDVTYPYAGTKSCRLRDSKSPDTANEPYLEYIGSDGAGKDGGVGTFSFYYRSWDGSPPSVYDVTYSIDGGAYQSAGTINTTSTTYAQFSYDINSTSDNIKIRVQRVSGERLHIDEFYIEDNGAPSGHETDAHVAAGGAGAQATISSLVDTEVEAQTVLTFDVRDDGTGSSDENTVINGVSIVAGSANTVLTDWTKVIAGAKLTDGTNTWTGTITAGAINFTGTPMTTLPDGGAWQNWSLSIWLTNTLPYNADNEILEFKIGPTNFTTDTADAGFDPTDVPVESGDTNNKIDIVATQLGITTQPPATVAISWTFTVRAGFTDVNGGIDEDFASENITLSVATGTGNLTSVSGLTKASTNGQSAWTDLLYDKVEDDVVLQAVSVTYPGPAYANSFDCASIAVDAYPICWDGNATVDAVPFVVHISIRNWEFAAGQDCYLKVYDGSNNPFHYTVANGWNSTTAWNTKPIITLDANGDWSGWLALKSKGLVQFRPRVALVSSTSTYITGPVVAGIGVNIASGGNGAIVQDSDGSSLAPEDYIILAYNADMEIIGSWIAEDNDYPQDDAGGTIMVHGWRLAICALCDQDVTFEAWDPVNWPGSGSAFMSDVVTNACYNASADPYEVPIDVILPVEFAGLEAIAGDGSVTLEWATASETNNARFDIVRDGRVVGTVNGAGMNPARSEYEWTESGLDNGVTYTYTLKAIGSSGAEQVLATASAMPTFDAATVTEYALHQNYPNPFNPTTAIRFDLVESQFVTLTVFNVMGQEVATLVNGTMNAGAHVVSFDAANLPSGVYIYKIEAGAFAATKKMLLMK